MAQRVMLQGYYWLTLKKDSKKYKKECDKCQWFTPTYHIMPNELMLISSPRQFIQWGHGIVKHLPTTPGQTRFILVATNYFSKWVKAEAYFNIKGIDVVQIISKHIICWFGLPTNKTILSSLKKRFEKAKRTWTEE